EPRGPRDREQPPGGADPRRTPQVTTVDRGPSESPGLSLVLCGLSTLTVPCGLLGAERGAPPARKRHQSTTRETQQNRGPTENHREGRPGGGEGRSGLSGRSGARRGRCTRGGTGTRGGTRARRRRLGCRRRFRALADERKLLTIEHQV